MQAAASGVDGNPRAVPVESAAQAVARIRAGSTVTVSASSGLSCPDAVLAAIGERYAAEGEPRDLTLVHPIAAGDMYGIRGIDHVAQPGLLRRVVAGSLPSGPSSMEPPRIWQMVGSGEVEAYNLPSGVLFEMHRQSAIGGPGVLTQVGIDTFVDPRHEGGRMNEATTEALVEVVELAGQEWLFFPNLRIDVAIIRATTADENGNLTCENEGAPLGVLQQALAARASGGVVIAQVERTAAAGSLPSRSVEVPGVLVDAVVVDPDQMQATRTRFRPELAGVVRAPRSSHPAVDWGVPKVIARRAAMELEPGDAVNLGFGISALVPQILLEEGADDAVTWLLEQGPVGGVPQTDFQFGSASNPEAMMRAPDQFALLQGAAFDRALLSFLQLDGQGSVNVSRLGARPHVTAGVGGFVDITAAAKQVVFSGTFTAGGLDVAVDAGRLDIRTEGRHAKLVQAVEQRTFSGARAVARGQQVTVVTERCVLELRADGLTVVEVAPGVDVERDVLARADCRLLVGDDCRTMDPRLFDPAPIGLLAQPRA